MARDNVRYLVQWDNNPPRTQSRLIPIWHPVGRAGFWSVLLGGELVGVWTHYEDDKTVPCLGRGSGCTCKSRHLARRWQGYLAAYMPTADRLGILNLTIDAVRNCPIPLNPPDRELRGLHCRAYRLRDAKRAPMRVELSASPYDGEIPAAFDVKLALLRIWGMSDK